MTITAPPPGLQPEDYEEIEAAVMETARGRWFLAEYARRLRAADGERVLEAIARLEARLEARATLAPLENFSAADRLSELAWALRERGVEDFVCGKIDALARDLRTQGAAVVATQPEAPVSAAPAPPLEDLPQEVAKEVAEEVSKEVSEERVAPLDAPLPAPEPACEAPAVETTPDAFAAADAAAEASADADDLFADDLPADDLPADDLPADPRRAALAWLDRLPLVDRMALFA